MPFCRAITQRYVHVRNTLPSEPQLQTLISDAKEQVKYIYIQHMYDHFKFKSSKFLIKDVGCENKIAAKLQLNINLRGLPFLKSHKRY